MAADADAMPYEDLDDDTPPWERQQASPEASSSPLAKELDESGAFAALESRQARARGDAEARAIEQSQGYSFDSLRKAASDRLARMPDEAPTGSAVAGGAFSVAKRFLSPDPKGFLGPDVGMLTPGERKEAGAAELETAQSMAPRWRGYAGALPEEWSDAAYQKRIDERIAKAPAGEPVMAGDVFETSPWPGPDALPMGSSIPCPAPGADSVAFFRIWSELGDARLG